MTNIVPPHGVALFTIPFFYLRHGETTANATQTIGGSSDVKLTPLGHEQAQRAAVALRNNGITSIYSSHLSRAHDTALYVSRELEMPVKVIREISERDWGEYEGRPRMEARRGATPLKGETREAFTARVISGFGMIPAEGLPLVVAHSGVYRVLCRTLGVEEPREPIANCQPLRIEPPTSPGGLWTVIPLPF